MLICSTDELSQFCHELHASRPESIAVDTEFARSFSGHYPKLCLLQLACGNKQCVVDVLDANIDLTPVQRIFDDPKIFKVFHDCRQDLEALSRRFPRLPKPVFDTQVAAMMVDYYENSVGYSKLVEQFLGTRLNKLPFKRVDWSKRPLSDAKVKYALDDVVYLHKLYGILRDLLEQKDRFRWFVQEMENVDSVLGDNYDALLEGLDFFDELTEHEAVVARSVIEWRERVARFHDTNRSIVMNSKSILSITKDILNGGITSDEQLSKYVRPSLLRDLPFTLSEITASSDYRKPLSPINNTDNDRPILSMLTILLQNTCKTYGMSKKLVASKGGLMKAINRLPSSLTQGWRYEFFGHEVEAFLAGKTKLVFSVDNDKDGAVQLCVDVK